MTNIFCMQAETLVDHIKFDHGYTAKSPAIVNVRQLNNPLPPSPFSSPHLKKKHTLCSSPTPTLIGSNSCHMLMSLVTRDYGGIHPRAAAGFLSICHWRTSASSWWSSRAESKVDNREKGIIILYSVCEYYLGSSDILLLSIFVPILTKNLTSG